MAENQRIISTIFIGDIAFNTDITSKKIKTSIGGAAYYSAVGAIAASQYMHQESRVGVVARVGGDFPLGKVQNKGIDSQGLKVISNEKTCEFILTQHDDNTREFEAIRHVAAVIDTSDFPASYIQTRFVHLATSLPQNYLVWENFLLANTQAIISADAFEAFAQQFPELTIQALNNTNLIFINEFEASILSRYGSLRTDIPWVFKRGSGGASYLYGSSEISVTAKKVEAIETTGAGDILAGAFLSLISHGYEIEQSLQIAVDIATKSVTQFGVEHLQ